MSFEKTEIGPATLYRGECLEILAAGLLKQADALVPDPPYGIAFKKGKGGGGLGADRHEERMTGDDRPCDPAPWLATVDVMQWRRFSRRRAR